MDLTNLVQAWFHAAQHQKLTRELRSLGHVKKKEKLLQATQQATMAACRHDARGLYEATRTLAPKQTRRMIRFRSPTGGSNSPEDEIKILTDHFTETFTASTSEISQLAHTDFPLTVQDVAQQLRKFNAFKAVAPNTIPSVLLKALSQPIANWIVPLLHEQWGKQPMIPTSWKDAHLALLAKRSVHSPMDLRPIALTCGVGKAVLGA